jgi:hypothetical protein
MSHSPVHFALLFATPAELAAYTGVVDDGDTAAIPDGVGGFARIYTYGSKNIVGDNITTIEGPGGVGGWVLNGGVGTYDISYVIFGGTLVFSSSSDSTIDDVTTTVVKNGLGDYTITFNAGSVVRPTAAAPFIGSVVATANADAFASCSAKWDGAAAIRVRTATVGLDGAPSAAADYDVSLSISMYEP